MEEEESLILIDKQQVWHLPSNIWAILVKSSTIIHKLIKWVKRIKHKKKDF